MLQILYFPATWWRREWDWVEWMGGPLSLGLLLLLFLKMFQWFQMNHWNCSRLTCHPQSPIWMPSFLKSMVCAFLRWFNRPESCSERFPLVPLQQSHHLRSQTWTCCCTPTAMTWRWRVKWASTLPAVHRKRPTWFISWCPSVWKPWCLAPRWFCRPRLWRNSPNSYTTNWVSLSARLELSRLRVRNRSCWFLFHNHCLFSVTQAVTRVSLCSSVVFLVFSPINSISAQLKSNATLQCGFRQKEAEPGQEVGIAWRLQHKGKGWKVLHLQTRLDDTEQSAQGGCCVDGWWAGFDV